MENKNQLQTTEWTIQRIADAFEQSVRTLRRLPPVKVRGYFSLWPDIRYSEAELLQQEKCPLVCRPSAKDISEMEQTLEWIVWLEKEERKLVWTRANKVPWKMICRQFGCGRTKAWQNWQKALTKVLNKLEAADSAVNKKNRTYDKFANASLDKKKKMLQNADRDEVTAALARAFAQRFGYSIERATEAARNYAGLSKLIMQAEIEKQEERETDSNQSTGCK